MVLGAALLLVLGAVSPVIADDATSRIRGFFTNVNRTIADPGFEERMPERLVALRAMVVEIVDFGHAAEVALGAAWRTRTRGEREEFVRLFTDLLQTSVFAMVGGRARIDNGLTVTYVGELNDGDGVTVATSVLTRSGAEMAVGYRMARRNGRWMVRDVVVDGVSLVDNYRAQFQKVIQRASYAGLVNEMRVRITELGRPTETTTATTASAPVTVAAATPANLRAAAVPEAAPPPPGSTVVEAPAPPAARTAVAPVPPPVRTAEAPAVETPRAAEMRVVSAVAPLTITPRPARVTFWVQVGAFREVDRAMRVVTALRDQAVSMITAPGHPLVRVLVGPFTDRAGATTKLREMRARGYEAFIAEVAK